MFTSKENANPTRKKIQAQLLEVGYEWLLPPNTARLRQKYETHLNEKRQKEKDEYDSIEVNHVRELNFTIESIEDGKLVSETFDYEDAERIIGYNLDERENDIKFRTPFLCSEDNEDGGLRDRLLEQMKNVGVPRERIPPFSALLLENPEGTYKTLKRPPGFKTFG